MIFFKISETEKLATATLVMRLVLGVVIFAHGAQKMFGWFGGHGYRWTVEAWSRWFGFPELLTHLVIWAEVLAPIFLIIGLFARYAALIIGGIMIGAIFFVHEQWGFFMNWYGLPRTGEGFEYHVLILAMVFSLLILGSGKWSISNLVQRKKENEIQ